MLSELSLSLGLLIDHSQAHLQISRERGGLREWGGGNLLFFFFFLLVDMVMLRTV